jgi:hypothetical protein
MEENHPMSKRARRFADTITPGLDEMCRIIDYPDRRIKPVVYTMLSSVMRLEAWNYLLWSHVKQVEEDTKIIWLQK